MKTSFKEMLRDRTPTTINLALLWCKAKERWLDHVYYSFIAIYSDKQERYNAVKVVLGLKKNKPHFDFHDTIDWDNLTPEEELYWKVIESWVDWFKKQYRYVENTYDIYSKLGRSEESIIKKIQEDYISNYDQERGEKLATFLYNHFSK